MGIPSSMDNSLRHDHCFRDKILDRNKFLDESWLGILLYTNILESYLEPNILLEKVAIHCLIGSGLFVYLRDGQYIVFRLQRCCCSLAISTLCYMAIPSYLSQLVHCF